MIVSMDWKSKGAKSVEIGDWKDLLEGLQMVIENECAGGSYWY